MTGAAARRAVSLPRLSGLLYALLALLMLGLAGLTGHGMLRTVESAGRALAFRETADHLVDLAIEVARTGHGRAEFGGLLEDWLLATAPAPQSARQALAEARARGEAGNPRLVARESGQYFDPGELGGSLLQGYLFLAMRDDRERAVETVLNALANRYGSELERRAVRGAVDAWIGGETADADVEAALRGLTARESPARILGGAGLALLALALFGATGLFFALRFAVDARRVYRRGYF